MDFTRAVEKQVEGVPGRDGLLQQIKPRQEEFRVAIRTTAPCFVPRYRGSQSQETMFEDGTNGDWEPHRRLSFLEGEEDYGEIGLDDGKEIFIDDVLETAEWYAVLTGHLCFHAHRECLIQGGYERTAKQLSIYCPEGYIVDTVSQWDAPGKTLFDITVMKLKEMTLRVVDSYFGLYAHGSLTSLVSRSLITRACLLNPCTLENSS